jgi:hypothetical protein
MANETYADIILRFVTDLKGIESAQAAVKKFEELAQKGGTGKVFSDWMKGASDFAAIAESSGSKGGAAFDKLVERIRVFAEDSGKSLRLATQEILAYESAQKRLDRIGSTFIQGDFLKTLGVNPHNVQQDWSAIQTEFDRNLAAVQRKLGDAAKNPQMSFFDMLEQKPQTGTGANKQKILDIQGFKNQAEKDAWYKSYEEDAASAEAAAAKATPVIEKYNQALAGGVTGEKKATTGIGNEVDSQKLKDYATKTGQAYEDVLNTLYKGGPGADKILNDMASSTSAVGDAAKNAAGQMGGVDNALKKTDETAKKAGRNIYALFGGFGSFFLSFAGKDITKFGTMLISPLQKLIAAASGSGVGAAWANNTKRIEDSYVRIGAVMARTLLPMLEQAAKLAESVAKFAEAHPGLVNAVVGLGGLSLAVGKLLSLAASAGMIGSALVTMGALKPAATAGSLVLGDMFGGAAGQGIGAAITTKLLGSSPAIGATLGNAIGMAFLKYVILPLGAAVMAWEIWKFGEKAVQRAKGVPESEIKTSEPSDLKRNAQYAIAAGAFNLYAIIEGWKSFNGETPKTRQELAKLALSIAGLGDAAAAGNGVLSKEAVDAYAQYDKQRVEMEQQYEEQRTQIVADNGAARVELESKYESDRNKLIEDYNKQASQAYSQYQKSLKSLAADFARGNSEATVQYQQDLAKLTVDFHQSQVDAQKDHQKRLRKLAQEHADNVEHLTNTRDALGLAQENRDYKRKVAEENAEFRADSAKRKAEYKKQVAELQQKYAQDEAKRLEEYNRQKAELTANYQEQAAITAAALTAALADLDKKHKEEEKKLAETEKKQLSEMESAHNKQEKELRKSLNDQLNTLGIWTGNMKTMYDAYYRDMETKLRDWITTMENQVPSSSGTPGMASGGYASGRTYRLHNGEFVMNPSTTAMAEKLTSGRLTQGGIIGALSRAGNIVVNQMLRFSGELGASDKRQIQKIAHESAMNGVMTAIGA